MVLYPYVYLPVRAVFLMQSRATLEVARTLGADRLRVFFRVAIPLARPAIVLGVSLALMEALNDIGASEFLGVRTLTVAIYTTWTVRMSVEGAAQIALVMLAVVFALILIERWARRHQRYAARRAPPSHSDAADAFRVCGVRSHRRLFLPILFGFLVPASHLVVASWRRFQVAGLPGALLGWIRRQHDARRRRDPRHDPRRAGACLLRATVAQSHRAGAGADRFDRMRGCRALSWPSACWCRSPPSTIASPI